MDYKVILAATWGRISGVDVFSTHLVRGLREQGIAAHILLTEPDEVVPDPMPFPSDIPVARLPVKKRERRRNRWLATIRYLEEQAPCIYIPNYDWYHSCVSPRLSNRVGIVGVVHSDDPVHYEHVKRLGRYWNAIVAVSPAIAAEITTLSSTLAQRLVTLLHGIVVPNRLPEKRHDLNQPLRVVYAGRLV
ncbi:MAG: glycosyltransferase [bacterium]